MARPKASRNGRAGAAAESPAGMVVEAVPIGSVSPDPANVRRHPERNVEAIVASLRRFGQQRPILVDEDGIVRAGNGTLAAAKELGWDTIRIVRTTLRDSEATAYAIADNRTALLAEWDDDALKETLRALEGEGFDLDAAGWNQHELDALLGSGGALSGPVGEAVDDPAGEWEGMPEFEHEDQTSAFKAHVHFRNEDDLKAFEELVGQKVPRDRWAIWYPPAEIERYADKSYALDGEGQASLSGLHPDQGAA
jgi:hypothetical protein